MTAKTTKLVQVKCSGGCIGASAAIVLLVFARCRLAILAISDLAWAL